MVNADGNIKTEPVVVLATRIVPRGDFVAAQWLIRWLGLSQEDDTWEDMLFIHSTFIRFKS